MQLITAAEAARLIGCTQQWVTQLIRDGKLPAQKVGQTWVIRRVDVEDYIASRGQN